MAATESVSELANETATPTFVTEAKATPAVPVVQWESGAAVRIVGVSLVVGTVGSILIYQHEPALGVALWVFLLIGALFLLARVLKVQAVRQNLFIVLPVLFFAAMLAVRYDPNLTLVNLGAGTFAALLLVHFFAGGNIAQQDLIQHGVKATLAGINVAVRPITELVQTGRWFVDRRRQWGSVMPIVRGLLITLPVVVIFIVLLSSADSVFSDMVGRIIRLFTFRTGDDLAGYTVVTLILAWTAVGGFAYALHDHKAKRAPSRKGAPTVAEILDMDAKVAPLFSLGFTETTMLLSSVCAVFASFVAVQFVYLFGGARNIDVAKFNYADYVHRGFAELIIVALLTLGMAYLLNVVAIRRTRRQLITLRSLLTILIVLTGVILVSAFQRMRLYEEAYGFTSLRLVIEVFIGWLGLLFVGFALSLYWQPVNVNVFGLATLIAVFGFAATLDLVNPDAFVAREMIDRNDVDPIYLASLSDEAVPAMIGLIDVPEKGLRDIVIGTLAQRESLLLANIDWRDFSLDRNSATSAVMNVKDKIASYPGAFLYYSSQSIFTAPGTDKIVPIPGAPLYLTSADLTFLRKGLSYRDVIRHAGIPWEMQRLSAGRDGLELTYHLNDGSSIRIVIDTVDGVISW